MLAWLETLENVEDVIATVDSFPMGITPSVLASELKYEFTPSSIRECTVFTKNTVPITGAPGVALVDNRVLLSQELANVLTTEKVKLRLPGKGIRFLNEIVVVVDEEAGEGWSSVEVVSAEGVQTSNGETISGVQDRVCIGEWVKEVSPGCLQVSRHTRHKKHGSVLGYLLDIKDDNLCIGDRSVKMDTLERGNELLLLVGKPVLLAKLDHLPNGLAKMTAESRVYDMSNMQGFLCSPRLGVQFSTFDDMSAHTTGWWVFYLKLKELPRDLNIVELHRRCRQPVDVFEGYCSICNVELSCMHDELLLEWESFQASWADPKGRNLDISLSSECIENLFDIHPSELESLPWQSRASLGDKLVGHTFAVSLVKVDSVATIQRAVKYIS